MTMTRFLPIIATATLLAGCGIEPEKLATNDSGAPANSAKAAPTVEGPLSAYIGKAPTEAVDGVTFLDQPTVRNGVAAAVRYDDPSMWVFRNDTTRRPIVMKEGRLLSYGCETGNCAGRNWAVLIDPLGVMAEVCYYAGGQARWYASGRNPAGRPGGCPTE